MRTFPGVNQSFLGVLKYNITIEIYRPGNFFVVDILEHSVIVKKKKKVLNHDLKKSYVFFLFFFIYI